MRSSNNRNLKYLHEDSVNENPQLGRSQNLKQLTQKEEKGYQLKNMQLFVDPSEFEFLKNNQPLQTSQKQKYGQHQQGNINNKHNIQRQQLQNNKDNQSLYKLDVKGVLYISQMPQQDDEQDKSCEFDDNRQVNDKNIENQPFDESSNQQPLQNERQKYQHNSNYSPIKLPQISQHNISKTNVKHQFQPQFNPQDSLKDKQRAYKDMRQSLYQMMVPQESYYEQYNGFYHQNDYSMNINEDIIKKQKKGSLQKDYNDENNQFNSKSFNSYIQSGQKPDNNIENNTNQNNQNQNSQYQQNQEQNTQSGSQQNNDQYQANNQLKNNSQFNNLKQNNQYDETTPMFKKDDYDSIKQNILNQSQIHKNTSKISEEDEQQSTRSFSRRKASSDQKDHSYSSMQNSKISQFQTNPSYSFIDHVNAKISQIRQNQQNQFGYNNNSQLSMISNPKYNLSDSKKARSITVDSNQKNNEFENKQNLTNDLKKPFINNHLNTKKINTNKLLTEPAFGNYPINNQTDAIASNIPDSNKATQFNQQMSLLNQLRQRSSRSLLKDPNANINNSKDPTPFSFQNSKSDKFYTPNKKYSLENQQYSAF